MGESEHIDLDEEAKKGRKGWFVKEADDMPQHKKYRTSCKSTGNPFLGPNFGAHHVLPMEAFDESLPEDDQQKELIKKVQWVTPFILNRPSNMIGLPSFWSYDAWYEDADYPGNSANWQTSIEDSTKQVWKTWIDNYRAGKSKRRCPEPKDLPIHLPVSWGHLPYTDLVIQRLRNMWKCLKEEKSDHKITRENFDKIQSELQAAEGDFMAKLKGRGPTSPELWQRRKTKGDNGWFDAYTMTKIKTNPIWG